MCVCNNLTLKEKKKTKMFKERTNVCLGEINVFKCL